MGIIFIKMGEKCAIFIDGGYLTKIIKKYFNGISLDYLKLSNLICKNSDLDRLRTYVYHCLPIVRSDNQEDIKRKVNMERFLAKLKRLPRFEVKLGKLQLIGNQFKQKMIDVLMSLDITNMSYENQIQHALLIAGDSDFDRTYLLYLMTLKHQSSFA